MQVAFYLAGEITQVKESIPWVRCASGNVFYELYMTLYKVEVGSALYKEGVRWTESMRLFGRTDIRTHSMVTASPPSL